MVYFVPATEKNTHCYIQGMVCINCVWSYFNCVKEICLLVVVALVTRTWYPSTLVPCCQQTVSWTSSTHVPDEPGKPARPLAKSMKPPAWTWPTPTHIQLLYRLTKIHCRHITSHPQYLWVNPLIVSVSRLQMLLSSDRRASSFFSSISNRSNRESNQG